MDFNNYTKGRVLNSFGEKRSDAVLAAAKFFGISRAAVYMWPDDKPIPAERILQLVTDPCRLQKFKDVVAAEKSESSSVDNSDLMAS